MTCDLPHLGLKAGARLNHCVRMFGLIVWHMLPVLDFFSHAHSDVTISSVMLIEMLRFILSNAHSDVSTRRIES